MFCPHCGGALASADTAHSSPAIGESATPIPVCPHCGKAVNEAVTETVTPPAEATAAASETTSEPAKPVNRKPAAPVKPPPPGSLPLAWIGLLASIAWVLKSPHPTWGVGVLCLCAGLISSFGARRRGRSPWPGFFTGLLPVGVALFFALLMLRPLFR